MEFHNRRSNRRRKGILFAAVSLVWVPIGTSLPAESETGIRVSQGEVLKLALGSSFTIREERIRGEVGEQGVRAARGVYDPTLELNYFHQHREGWSVQEPGMEPGSDQTLEEAGVGVRGLVPWGGRYGVFLDSVRTESGADDRETATTAKLQLVQPVLRGFQRGPEWAAIRIAHNRRYQLEEDFREAVMDVVADTLIAYNDLVYAQRNLAVAQRNAALAQQLVEDNQDRVRRGAMAPMDVLQAESAVALRRGLVLDGEQFLREANIFLLSRIHEDLTPHLGVQILVEEEAPPEIPDFDTIPDLTTALALRPDYRRARLHDDLREIEWERARNRARPQLDLVGNYGVRGSSGTRGGSFRALHEDGSSFYGAGVQFSIPIPGRDVTANRVAARMEQQRSELLLRELRQSILVLLDIAAHRMNTYWQQLAVARETTLLARRALAAEEDRLNVGMSSSFVVLRLQEDVANAERREALTERNYRNAVIRYQREVGTILETHRIYLPGDIIRQTGDAGSWNFRESDNR